MNKDSKIYVAGHRGMVGSAIVRKLKEEGYTNLMLLTHKELDLLDQRAVKKFYKTERPEYVFVAAAKVGGILANNTYRAQFIYENLQIQNNLIHFAHVYGVKKLLFLGSSCIYPKMAPQPIKEEYLLTGSLEPTNEPYAIAKIAGIKMCENYYRQYGSNFISVMPTNLYGLNDNFDLETSHVLPALIRKFYLAKCLENDDWEGIRKDLNKRPIESVDGEVDKDAILNVLGKYGIGYRGKDKVKDKDKDKDKVKVKDKRYKEVVVTLWGSGKPRREFLHVDDLADAVLYVANNVESKNLYGMGITHLNIGTGKDLTIADLAVQISDIIGYKGKIEYDHSKPDGTPQKLLDVNQLKKLGWVNKIKFIEGIEKTYQWFTKNLN